MKKLLIILCLTVFLFGCNATSTNTTSKYVGNYNTKQYHLPSCQGAKKMKTGNKWVNFNSKEEAQKAGYTPCSLCNP